MYRLFFLSFLFMFSQETFSQDWPNLLRYRDADEKLGNPVPGEKRIVFMGNSITEGWINAHPEFFRENHLINRGIGGQTTPQMVLRFRQDVIDLKPAAVFILAGINDIAGNTGPSTLKMIKDNFENMAFLAEAARIKVVLCSILPSNKIPWRDNMNPSEKIRQINTWMKSFAESHQFEYVDYYSVLKDDKDGLPQNLSQDGVHPTPEGYLKMEQVVLPYIRKIREFN